MQFRLCQPDSIVDNDEWIHMATCGDDFSETTLVKCHTSKESKMLLA